MTVPGMGMLGDAGLWASTQSGQLERLFRGMDELRQDIGELVVKTEVMGQRLAGIEDRLRRMEDRTEATKQQSWQSWFIAIVGLIMAVVTVGMILKLLGAN